MKNIIQNIFNQDITTPPAEVQQGLIKNFASILNVEWSMQNDQYEAVFYKDKIEHIALFSAKGELLEYKITLSEHMLPFPIKKGLKAKGEIMNIISRNKSNNISYEVIVRDAHLQRFIIILAENGAIISEQAL